MRHRPRVSRQIVSIHRLRFDFIALVVVAQDDMTGTPLLDLCATSRECRPAAAALPPAPAAPASAPAPAGHRRRSAHLPARFSRIEVGSISQSVRSTVASRTILGQVIRWSGRQSERRRQKNHVRSGAWSCWLRRCRASPSIPSACECVAGKAPSPIKDEATPAAAVFPPARAQLRFAMRIDRPAADVDVDRLACGHQGLRGAFNLPFMATGGWVIRAHAHCVRPDVKAASSPD